MSVYEINSCDNIAEIGKLLHWIIDDPTITNYDRTTAIRAAESKIAELVEKESDSVHKTYEGKTIISWLVICQGWNEEVEDFIKHLVLEFGVNIDQRCNRNFTPLMWAAIFDRYRAITLLLSLGANPKLEQSQGKDAFYFADECDNKRSIAALKVKLNN